MRLAHWIPICCLPLLANTSLRAQEPASELEGLQKAADTFVTAYNRQDAGAIAKLFTENGEITNLQGNQQIQGNADIEAHYRQVFAQNPLQIALDVASVRFVAPKIAIEDGTYHLTPGDDESVPPKSFTYTTVLTQAEGGDWHIASTRTLEEVTEPAGHLAPLVNMLMGEWTCEAPDGVRLDLAFGWDATGNFLTGETLTTRADAEPQTATVRIGYDRAKKRILSWMFDAKGGFTQGTWTPANDGWIIQSQGTTADGETQVSSQKLTRENAETLVWSSSHRVIGGESVSDVTLRLVRQAPDPAED